jgi:hypothetical protein
MEVGDRVRHHWFFGTILFIHKKWAFIAWEEGGASSVELSNLYRC